jgi:carboxymethylenebutenolidase
MRRVIQGLCLSLLMLAATGVNAATMSDAAYIAAMAAMHAGDTPAPTPVAVEAPSQPVRGSDVVYAKVGGKDVKGYLTKPANAKGPLPAVIAIHEWWGLNDNIRRTADRLAGEGYEVLAVDLYNGQSAATADDATKLMTAAMADTASVDENLKQAYGYLHDHERAPKVAVLGWCFGGGWSLQTALMLPDKLAGVIMYYGRPVTDVAQLSKLRMPLIGFFGAEDKGITPDNVHDFETALRKAKVAEEIHIYPNAGHAFANPSGEHYQADAAKDSWQRMIKFLHDKL